MIQPVIVWQLLDESSTPARIAFSEVFTLDDATRHLPDGAYTTFRTYHKYGVLRLNDHFRRLEDTARLANHPVALRESAIRVALRQVLDDFNAPEARVRLCLDLTQKPGTLYLVVAELATPSQQEYDSGVQVQTRAMHRDNPKAKLTAFVQTASELRSELPEGIQEILMVGPDGIVLEGLSSNFFAVRAGTIWTAEAGVLSGITRSLVIEAAEALGIAIQYSGVPVAELDRIDEAFITSASRAVLPVVAIDGKAVGSGAPGPVTRRLALAYRERLIPQLEFV